MLLFPCSVCRTQLSVDESQVGQLVRCPTCMAAIRVPSATRAAQTQTVPAYDRPPVPPQPQQKIVSGVPRGGDPAAPDSPQPSPSYAPPQQRKIYVPSSLLPRGGAPGKRYGFNCAYCSSRLEANDAVAGQEGTCPTCGNTIIIPIMDRYGRLIDPVTQQVIKQDPHPVHAYAAAGTRAPHIVRLDDGSQAIECPRCQNLSPITANNCKACGMPFTMEGTTMEAAGTSNSFCVASLVLGIIGLPGACIVVPSLLAIVFGIIGYNQVSKLGVESAGKGLAIAGIICGSIGALIAFSIYVL